jgi:hypothetical protein
VHFTPEYLDKQRQFLVDEWIGDPAHPSPRSQLVSQQNNKHLAKHMAHRLHWIGISLFVLAALACVVHLIVDFGEWSPEWLRRLLTLFAVVFPVFGAAVGAIGSQAEFSRLAERSEAMVEVLKRHAQELKENLAEDPQAQAHLLSVHLGRIAEQTAQSLISDVLDWRVLFFAHPLSLPA